MKKSILAFTLVTLVGHQEASARPDRLVQTQRIVSDILVVNNTRLRLSAENMANAKSANYEPKYFYVHSKKDRKYGHETVEIKRIRKDQTKVRKEFNPSHPYADAEGYVNMPDISPITEMVNLQQAKLDNERAMKVYEVTTDLRYKMIGMMSSR